MSRVTFGRPRILVGNALLALVLGTVSTAAIGATLEQLLNAPYFDRSDIETVREGRIALAKIHEASDRELAVAIACLVHVPSEEALAPFLGDSLPVSDEHLRAQGMIDPASPAVSFADISLDRDNDRETRYFLDARPGYGLNLSSNEIETFRALRGANDPAAVEATLEDVLHTRYLAYRESGLAGAPPYAREDGELVSPGDELRRTAQAMTGLHELYPEFHNAWLNYPSRLPEDIVRDDYFWLKLDIEERPTFVLSHRLEARDGDMHLVGVRDYYMSHFFDVLQRAAVVTRTDAGQDVLIYVERAWVDYWTGLAAIKRKIGRKILAKQMEHLLEDRGICGSGQ